MSDAVKSALWWAGMIGFFVAMLALGLLWDAHKESQCERNGLGEWHYSTQVCEPVRR